MPMFTADQIRRIREIVRRYHSRVGIDVFDRGPAIDKSRAYGALIARTGDLNLMDQPPEVIERELAAVGIEDLSALEKAAVEMAKRHAGEFIAGLGDRVTANIVGHITSAERNLPPDKILEIVRSKTALNREKRKTIKNLRRQLYESLGDAWTRDFTRLATTEVNNAIQNGAADQFEKRHGDPQVSKMPRPDACPDCMRLYTDGGVPKVFRLSELRENGSNIGRKRKDWQATIGAIHPWCGCMLVRVPDGMRWEGTELVPNETKKSLTPIDTYVGHVDTAPMAYVIHRHENGSHVDDKVMLGFPSELSARRAFIREHGDQALGSLTALTVERLAKAMRHNADKKLCVVKTIPNTKEPVLRKAPILRDAFDFEIRQMTLGSKPEPMVNVVQGADDVPRPRRPADMTGIADAMGLTVKGKKKRKKDKKIRNEQRSEQAKLKRKAVDAAHGMLGKPRDDKEEATGVRDYAPQTLQELRTETLDLARRDNHKIQLILDERRRRAGTRISEAETFKHYRNRKQQHKAQP